MRERGVDKHELALLVRRRSRRRGPPLPSKASGSSKTLVMFFTVQASTFGSMIQPNPDRRHYERLAPHSDYVHRLRSLSASRVGSPARITRDARSISYVLTVVTMSDVLTVVTMSDAEVVTGWAAVLVATARYRLALRELPRKAAHGRCVRCWTARTGSDLVPRKWPAAPPFDLALLGRSAMAASAAPQRRLLGFRCSQRRRHHHPLRGADRALARHRGQPSGVGSAKSWQGSGSGRTSTSGSSR